MTGEGRIAAVRWAAIVLFSLDSATRAVLAGALLFDAVEPSDNRLAYLQGLSEAQLDSAAILGITWAFATAAIAWGLFRWRSWARWLAIVYWVAALGAVAVIAVPSGPRPAYVVLGLVALVMMLLLMHPRVADAFRRRGGGG